MQRIYAISELLATDREEHEKDPFEKKNKMYQIANGNEMKLECEGRPDCDGSLFTLEHLSKSIHAL